MENFERYFLHEKKILLDNISYETVKVEGRPAEMKLGVKDTIVAQLMKNGVKINFNRALNFEPEGIFSLSVTYSMMLIFDPTTKDEVNWKGMDIATEFKNGCPHLLTALMSRTSLMISQITSAGGQNPIVTPAAPVAPQVQ
ncbi:MAG: hypothetical protein E7647_03465 [Ruminococcaceae bacterium]|nr:hypothetical protein [Oscillospiraceae bacterium]